MRYLLFIFVLASFGNALICPLGWTYYNEQCWFVSNHQLDWASADDECKSRLATASLAVIQNKESEQILTQLLEVSNLSKNGREEFFQASFSIQPSQCFHRRWKEQFMLGPNIVLFGNLQHENDCFNECWRARSVLKFDCKSVVWSPPNKECLLSEGHTRLDSDTFKDIELARDFRLFEDICHNDTGHFWATSKAQKADRPPTASPINNVRHCFSKHQRSNFYGFVDKVLIELGERECLGHCLKSNSSHLDCKTVIYYRQKRQCILTSTSIKTHPTKLIKQQLNSDVFERRLDCQFGNCEDLEISLIFAIDTQLLSSNLSHVIDLLTETLHRIGTVTEFYRLTLVRINVDGPFTVLMQEQQFADFNELTTIVGQALSQPTFPFVGSRNLLLSLQSVTEFAVYLSNNTDIDLSWLIVLATGDFGDFQDNDFSQLQTRLKEAERNRSFSTTIVGIGEDIQYDQLLKLVDERPNRFIHSQHVDTVAKQLVDTVCILPRKWPANERPKMEPTNDGLWIGLKRNNVGEVQWTNDQLLTEYETKKLRTLDIFPEKGDCVQWNSTAQWEYELCSENRRFVCSLKPEFDVFKRVVRRLESKNFKQL